jgi:nucleoside phosphorylase
MSNIPPDILKRTELARVLLARGMSDIDFELEPRPGTVLASKPLAAALPLNDKYPFGLAPTPQPPNVPPDPSEPLPRADVLVITWTVDEQDALADVLTPGKGRNSWIRYNRHFEELYAPQIRAGSPSSQSRRLGSWMSTKIGQKLTLCFKSELHLNQDGIRNKEGAGIASLPVRDLFRQIIAEVQPQVVLTVGTSGGVFRTHDLGDVVVTRAAKFRLQSEFKNAPYNGQVFKSDWAIPVHYFRKARELMQLFANNLIEPPLVAPTVRHKGRPFTAPVYKPDIKQDGKRGIAEFHPILTTDYFEFGTSANHLELEGCAVEMGDAVLGLVAADMPNPPRWAVVRNLSDPQINGAMDQDLQVDYAVWYYTKYGYWTSVMSALATWAIVAGLP